MSLMHPTEADLTFQVTAGRLLRKRVRAMIEGEAWMAGLGVECQEARGILNSTFYFKVSGPSDKVVHFSRGLDAWGEMVGAL